MLVRKHGDIDDVVPTRAGVFQNQSYIFKYRTALHFDIVIGDLAGRTQRHTGYLLAATHAWANAGEKQKIPDAFCVRESANRFRCARAFERLTHFLVIEDTV